MNDDEIYMGRCLQLAEQAAGETSPNPMVGAVIVYKGRIIGEGYHKHYGQAHAEVNAIASVKNPELLKDATMYVSLEPCSHYGKTPPCSKLIIDKHIKKVVIGMTDPNPKVCGRGIKMLKEAGVEVEKGVLEKECFELNRRFITFFIKKRPYVILKWAQTSDGFIDKIRTDPAIPPLKISNEITKTLNHQIRSEEAAILVGTNTALLDNPKLTTTKWDGHNPVRVILDKDRRIPETYHIFDGKAPTLIFTEKDCQNTDYVEYIKIHFEENVVPQILNVLYQKEINSVIVEGGTHTLTSFIESGLWDECHIETSPVKIGNGVKAPKIKGSVFKTEWFEKNRMDYFRPIANT